MSFGRVRASGLRALLLWGPPAAWLALSFYASSLPGESLPSGVPDYLAHAAQFAVLAVLLARALAAGRPAPAWGIASLGAFLLCLCWAIADEWHQSFVPGRDTSVRDVVADLAGSGLGLAAAPWLLRRAARAGGGAAAARLTLLTRRGCRLCDEARRLVEGVAPEYDVHVEVRDVDGSAELADAYGSVVPVLLVDGRQAFRHRVDERRLRRRLRRWRRSRRS